MKISVAIYARREEEHCVLDVEANEVLANEVLANEVLRDMAQRRD